MTDQNRPPHPSRVPALALLVSVALVVITFVAVSYVPHVLPVDFLVYRDAAPVTMSGRDFYAGNLLAPELGPVGMPFTYTPFAAIALLPTALLPWRVAFGLWTLLCTLVIAGVTIRFHDWSGVWRVRWSTVAAFWAACATTVVIQHLVYGQINLLLMAVVLGDVLLPRVIRGRRRPVGIFIGLAAAVKLTPALFVVHFLVTRQWRSALWASVGFIGATGIGFLFAGNASVHFWTSVVFHLSDRVDLTGSAIASSGNNSITGVVTGLFALRRSAAEPWLLLAGAAGLWVAARIHGRGDRLGGVLVIGLVATLLSPISWIHHWVYILPAGLLVISRLQGTRRRWMIATLAILVVPGPSFGDFINSNLSALSAIAPLWRESLVIVGILLLVASLATAAPDRPVGHYPKLGFRQSGANQPQLNHETSAGAGRQGTSRVPSADSVARPQLDRRWRQ